MQSVSAGGDLCGGWIQFDQSQRNTFIIMPDMDLDMDNGPRTLKMLQTELLQQFVVVNLARPNKFGSIACIQSII